MQKSAPTYDAISRPRGVRTRMMKVARIFIARIPPRLGNAIAAFTGEIIYRFARKSRRAVISNIGHVMAPVPRRKLKKAVRHVFHNVMRSYYELSRGPSMSEAEIDSIIDFDFVGWQRILDIHAQGRGVIIMTAHYGSFDIISQVLARHGLSVTVIIARVSPEWLSDYVTDLRAARGVQFLLVEEESGSGLNLGALKQSISLLRSGGVLAVLADRNMEQRGVTIPFFGYDTVVAPGVAKMALRTGSPVVVAIARRLEDYRFSVTFDEPIEPQGSASNPDDIRELLTKVFAQLEAHIRVNPEQWVLLQHVWPPNNAGSDSHEEGTGDG
jgi:lauroyl/myristoyl acyltransferase